MGTSNDVKAVLDKLKTFLDLKEGWDGFNAKPPSRDDLCAAALVVEGLSHVSRDLDVTALVDGGVCVQATILNRALSFNIGSTEHEHMQRMHTSLEEIICLCAPDLDGKYDRERICWNVEEWARYGLNPKHKFKKFPDPASEPPISLQEECPLQVRETDRETARQALWALMPHGHHATPFDVDALTILLGRVREDERKKGPVVLNVKMPESPPTDLMALQVGDRIKRRDNHSIVEEVGKIDHETGQVWSGNPGVGDAIDYPPKSESEGWRELWIHEDGSEIDDVRKRYSLWNPPPGWWKRKAFDGDESLVDPNATPEQLREAMSKEDDLMRAFSTPVTQEDLNVTFGGGK